MKTTVKWGVAIAFSLVAHAGAAAYLSKIEPEEAQVAGGEAMEVALLGNAFEETIQAGDPAEAVTPTDVPPQELAAVEPDVQPEEIVPPAEEVAVLPDAVPETLPDPTEIPPSEAVPAVDADVVLPATAEPPLTADDPLVTASLQPAEMLMPEIEDVVTPLPRPEPQKTVEKPERTPEKKKPQTKKVEKKDPPKKVVVERNQAGDRGKSAETLNRGSADGQQQAKAAGASDAKRGKRQQAEGNAAVSDYPGKVRQRLTRALRYPAEARRGGLKGDAHVRFTVTSSGQVASVSLARSTGSPVLDAAALDAVRRAAPFPKIPDGAGRTSWAFTIPLGFHR